ncbi:hypothetical protein BDR04DRAFT_1158532 [Suillus decipiens]|nr:hypothetical protein BDR04DRAFT_1158532 [Suillus decipiens]
MSLNLKRKPRDRPAAYNRPAKQQKIITKDTPLSLNSSSSSSSRQNLTLSDWMTVYSFIDSHPHATQAKIVNHFKSLKSGALVFTQSTLSRKLRERPKMEAHIDDKP